MDVFGEIRSHNKVLYTECHSWPWPLTPWPKINRIPPLIIHNLHVKFESDWAKTVVAIVSTKSYTQSPHVKFESDWAKTVVAIVSTRSYTHSVTVDLDFWPRDPKSIGFLLSSSTTYMWSLKVIGQKLWSLSCPQSLIHRVPMWSLKVIGQKLWWLSCPQGLIHIVSQLTLTFDPVTQNQ